MEFEVDVSGEDIFSAGYTICIANQENIIRRFKIDKKLIQILRSRYGQGLYKYSKSNKQKSLFKVRIYCIIIYYLFKSIKGLNEISLKICRDFDGKENDILTNLNYFLQSVLKLKIKTVTYIKLQEDSKAHKSASLIRKEKLPYKEDIYVNINVEDIERFLLKKVVPKGTTRVSQP